MTNNATSHQNEPNYESRSGYADVNGLKMYYEIHGEGQPLVLIHGAISTIEVDFGRVLPGFAETRQVIALECQGHGHTADIDRPLTYENMTNDTIALLHHLGITKADFFGYSMGSAIAMQVAIEHPEIVRKLVLAGGVSYNLDGSYAEAAAGEEALNPDDLIGTPFYEGYVKVAPNPQNWGKLLGKTQKLDQGYGWPPEAIRSIKAPTLIINGDSDIVRPEHVIEMFRLLGGGVPGDIVGIPQSQLAILPGTTHITLVHRADWLLSMVTEFLDKPLPETEK